MAMAQHGVVRQDTWGGGRARLILLQGYENQFSAVFQSSPTATLWTAARQASLSITNSQSLLKPMSIESVMPSNHLISVVPFSSCLQSFSASGSFLMSQLF